MFAWVLNTPPKYGVPGENEADTVHVRQPRKRSARHT